MRVAIYTLGCKVNQYETQAMEQELLRRGHTLVPFDETADVYVVNTCSVTAVSDHKSRQMLRRAKTLNPAAIVAGCGCYVQTHPEEAAGLGLDLVSGSDGHMIYEGLKTGDVELGIRGIRGDNQIALVDMRTSGMDV